MREADGPGYVLRRQGTLYDVSDDPELRGVESSAESGTRQEPAGSRILLERARVLFAAAQSDNRARDEDLIAELDQLVTIAKRDADPLVLAQLLRYAVVVRIIARAGDWSAAEELDEFEAYTARNGLTVLFADAMALRAKRALTAGHEDTAISEVARSLALLDDDPDGDQDCGDQDGGDQRDGGDQDGGDPDGEDQDGGDQDGGDQDGGDQDGGDQDGGLRRAETPENDSSERDYSGTVTTGRELLGTVLVDIAVVLMALGMFEIADQIMRRAQRVAVRSQDAHLEAVLTCNRIFLLLEWGRRLERLDFPDTARQNYVKASMLAKQTEPVFARSRFPREEHRPIADQHQSLAVAHAYANPGNQHYPRLRERLELAKAAHDRIDVALPFARCMEREGDYAAAVELLGTIVTETAGVGMLFPLLRVSLHRELARMTELAEGSQRSGAVQDYVHQLELELWQMRETRMVTLNTRREHERLAREHGTVTAQALQDPLTELPNRRAVTERLAATTADARGFPTAIALIDLDGFKRVNDRYSHGRGDEVLRAIAAALRETLRGDDLIARYGGDEFVAVLEGAPLHAAHAAVGRAVDAVDRLADESTLGVTLSVGVVAMGRAETQASVLARADAAMYQAKRRGGNTVVAVSGEMGPPSG